MSERTAVYLKDRRTGQFVEATLIDGVTRDQVERAEGAWKPFLDQQLKRMQVEGVAGNLWPQHRHWDWRWCPNLNSLSLSCGIQRAPYPIG
jgi:hypothetical protein